MIYDSKALVAADNFERKLFWTNDEEVLFVGYWTRPDASAPSTGVRRNYMVNVWNVRTNTIRTLREFGQWWPSLCFSDGHVLVRYRDRKDESLHSYYGDTKAIAAVTPERRFHDDFCRPNEEVPSLPNWTKGREVLRLGKVGAGFVDFGDHTKHMENRPARVYRHGMRQEEGVQLPVGGRDIDKSFTYHAFKDAFFVEGWYRQWPIPQGVPYPVYWLYPDGRLERIMDLPWGPWRSSASSWPIPTKAGILIVSHNANVRNVKDLAHAGLYLVADGKVARLLTAWIQATAVSPNGCRVAFDFADGMTQKRNTLKAIDVCDERAR